MDSSSPLPNSFDYENPSITIKPTVASGSPTPLILPIPLSALATFLSHAHAKSRQVPKPGWREATLVPSLQPSTPAQELAIAIDMFKSLNGERIVDDAEQVEGDERGLIDRLKHRLKRRRAKGPKEIRMTAGSEPVGRNGNLPEGECRGAGLGLPFGSRLKRQDQGLSADFNYRNLYSLPLLPWLPCLVCRSQLDHAVHVDR